MRILVIGGNDKLEEVERKLGDENSYALVSTIDHEFPLEDFELIFDFAIDSYPDHFEHYISLKKSLVLLNTVKISLSELQFTFGVPECELYGFNGLSGFINRELWEVSSLSNTVTPIFNEKLGDYTLVDDRVGLVTPRVVLMIINEAFYTVQEGTASKSDIDQAMKLGTNYPYGPFEWLKIIGIEDAYETLEAIYNDTNDERYKIAPLLKKEYLRLR